MEEFKICPKCGKLRPLTGRCKECRKLYNETHREYFRQKSKARYNPGDNPERYTKYKETYLQRRNDYSCSVRGRFISLLYSAKTRASKSKLEYNLDIDWLLDLYDKQKGCCLLTGIKLEFIANRGGKRTLKPFSPSLDRIDCTKGYTKDNVRLVITIINLAINNFGEEVFTQVASAYLSRKLY